MPSAVPSDILDTFWSGGSSSGVVCFCFFILFIVFTWQEYWSDLPLPSAVDHFLSEFFSITHPSWVNWHGKAHKFIELYKPLHHDKAVVHERGRK